jgi:hypothetical protein
VEPAREIDCRFELVGQYREPLEGLVNPRHPIIG